MFLLAQKSHNKVLRRYKIGLILSITRAKTYRKGGRMPPMSELAVGYCLVWGLIYGALIFPKYEADSWDSNRALHLVDLINYTGLIVSCLLPLIILNVEAREMPTLSLDRSISTVAIGCIVGHLFYDTIRGLRSAQRKKRRS